MQLLYKLFGITCLLCTLLMYGCRSKTQPLFYVNLPGYNLTQPTVIHLRSELDEISGIHFYPKDTSIFTITDEAGILYKIYVREKIVIKKWKFSKKEDYEDLVLVDSTFFALKSDGSITTIKFLSRDSLKKEHYEPPFKGKDEFETIFYDANQHKIVLLCKDCKSDSKNSLTAYAFDPVTATYLDTPYFVMDVSDVAEQGGFSKTKFKPSAAAINPISKDLYLISAINKVIVIASADGTVKEAYSINPVMFKQPEGLTFTPHGDLLISNEAAESGSPNILIFKYQALIDGKG